MLCREREREESINQFLTFHHRRHSEVAEKVLFNILIFQILRMQKWNINPTVLDGCMLVDVSTFLDALASLQCSISLLLYLMGSQPCCLTWCGHVIALITNYPLSCCTLKGGVAVVG